jgi:hypothetical protein
MSKSSYFEEVEFEVSESPIATSRPTTKIVPNPDKLAMAVIQIYKDFEGIKNGTSDLVHYAVDNGNFGSPAGNALKRIEANPSVETIKAFVQLAGQDLGGKAQEHFRQLLASTLEEVPNV